MIISVISRASPVPSTSFQPPKIFLFKETRLFGSFGPRLEGVSSLSIEEAFQSHVWAWAGQRYDCEGAQTFHVVALGFVGSGVGFPAFRKDFGAFFLTS